MDDSPLVEILQRLGRIEDRLSDHEDRLALIERRLALQTVQRTAERPPAIPTPPPRQWAPPPYPAPSTQVEDAPVSKVDREYQIGARLLPYTGATVFIIGLAYMVSLAIGRGLVTPAMLWWGVNALSVLFVGVGQWKREEKEQFGQVLTAIGSCGMYLNFAAGHVYQHLYSGETLVALFTAHSFAHLAYAFWRSSRAFLSLGVLGGLIASLMPLDKDLHSASVALHFLILAPAVLIAARNRWMGAAAGLYLVGTAALLPLVLNGHAPERLRSFAILATAILTVAGWGWSYRLSKFDPQGAFGPCALFGSGLLGFLCHINPQGSLAVLFFAVAVAAVAPLVRPEARGQILLGAIASAALIAPFGAWRSDPIFALELLYTCAALLAFLSLRIARGGLSILAVAELAVALLAYVSRSVAATISYRDEVLLLVLGIALLAFVTYAMVKAWSRAETLTLSSFVLGVPIAARLSVLLLGSDGLGFGSFTGLMFGFVALAACAVVMAQLSRWQSAIYLAWSVFVIAFSLFWVFALGSPATLAVQLVALFILAALVGALALVTTGNSGVSDSPTGTYAVAGALGGLLFVRLCNLLLVHAPFSLHPAVASMLGGCLVAGAAATIGVRKSLAPFGGLAMAYTIGVGAFAFGYASEGNLPFGQELMLTFVLLGALVGSVLALDRSTPDKDLLYYSTGLAGWLLLSRIGYLVLTQEAVGLRAPASVSIAWSATGLLFIAVGFVAHLRQLRYLGFFVFGATVVKVLTMDLSGLDPIVRVFTLLLLGLVMLGAGYWYIRSGSEKAQEG